MVRLQVTFKLHNNIPEIDVMKVKDVNHISEWEIEFLPLKQTWLVHFSGLDHEDIETDVVPTFYRQCIPVYLSNKDGRWHIMDVLHQAFIPDRHDGLPVKKLDKLADSFEMFLRDEYIRRVSLTNQQQILENLNMITAQLFELKLNQSTPMPSMPVSRYQAPSYPPVMVDDPPFPPPRKTMSRRLHPDFDNKEPTFSTSLASTSKSVAAREQDITSGMSPMSTLPRDIEIIEPSPNRQTGGDGHARMNTFMHDPKPPLHTPLVEEVPFEASAFFPPD
jgi:hypothetical protein